jgi:hypothetical protein
MQAILGWNAQRFAEQTSSQSLQTTVSAQPIREKGNCQTLAINGMGSLVSKSRASAKALVPAFVIVQHTRSISVWPRKS